MIDTPSPSEYISVRKAIVFYESVGQNQDRKDGNCVHNEKKVKCFLLCKETALMSNEVWKFHPKVANPNYGNTLFQ